MSIVMPLRVAETTATTGTGSLTLAGAIDAAHRSFANQYGAGSSWCYYVIEWDGGFEIGRGQFNGSDTLTRAEIIRSSNGDAVVNLSAGAKTVFALLDLGEPEWGFTGSLVAADVTKLPGSAARFTGGSPATAALPAVATLPRGFAVTFVNAGSAALTLDPDGSETIGGGTTLVLAPGQRATAVRRSSGWEAIGPSASAAALAALSTAAVLRDGSQPPTDDVSWGGARLTDLGDSINAQDAVNKGQLDAAVASVTGRLLAVTTFTSSGTWTPASGSTRYLMMCIGGGQGGGGYGAGTGEAGAGGQAGRQTWTWQTGNPGPQTVTVGAGGAGGGFGALGGVGGLTSIGSLLSAGGGTPDMLSTPQVTTQHLWSTFLGHNRANALSSIGVGNSSGANSAAGNAGYGAGGNGRMTNDTGAGGAGGSGRVMIWEYS